MENERNRQILHAFFVIRCTYTKTKKNTNRDVIFELIAFISI